MTLNISTVDLDVNEQNHVVATKETDEIKDIEDCEGQIFFSFYP